MLVYETERNIPPTKAVRYIPLVVTTCIDGEHDTPATGFHHLRFRSVQHHIQTFPGIPEFELGLAGQISSHQTRSMLLLIWVDSYDQVPADTCFPFITAVSCICDGSSYLRFAVRLYTVLSIVAKATLISYSVC